MITIQFAVAISLYFLKSIWLLYSNFSNRLIFEILELKASFLNSFILQINMNFSKRQGLIKLKSLRLYRAFPHERFYSIVDQCSHHIETNHLIIIIANLICCNVMGALIINLLTHEKCTSKKIDKCPRIFMKRSCCRNLWKFS